MVLVLKLRTGALIVLSAGNMLGVTIAFAQMIVIYLGHFSPLSKRFDMNESTALFFLVGLLVGLAVFDFVMLFYYILV